MADVEGDVVLLIFLSSRDQRVMFGLCSDVRRVSHRIPRGDEGRTSKVASVLLLISFVAAQRMSALANGLLDALCKEGRLRRRAVQQALLRARRYRDLLELRFDRHPPTGQQSTHLSEGAHTQERERRHLKGWREARTTHSGRWLTLISPLAKAEMKPVSSCITRVLA